MIVQFKRGHNGKDTTLRTNLKCLIKQKTQKKQNSAVMCLVLLTAVTRSQVLIHSHRGPLLLWGLDALSVLVASSHRTDKYTWVKSTGDSKLVVLWVSLCDLFRVRPSFSLMRAEIGSMMDWWMLYKDEPIT